MVKIQATGGDCIINASKPHQSQPDLVVDHCWQLCSVGDGVSTRMRPVNHLRIRRHPVYKLSSPDYFTPSTTVGASSLPTSPSIALSSTKVDPRKTTAITSSTLGSNERGTGISSHVFETKDSTSPAPLSSSEASGTTVDSPSAGFGLPPSSDTSASSSEMPPIVPSINTTAGSSSTLADVTTSGSAMAKVDQPSSLLLSTTAASSSSTVDSIVSTEKASSSSMTSLTTTAIFTETSLASTSGSISTSSVASAPDFGCLREGYYIKNGPGGTSLYTVDLNNPAISLITNNLNRQPEFPQSPMILWVVASTESRAIRQKS